MDIPSGVSKYFSTWDVLMFRNDRYSYISFLFFEKDGQPCINNMFNGWYVSVLKSYTDAYKLYVKGVYIVYTCIHMILKHVIVYKCI